MTSDYWCINVQYGTQFAFAIEGVGDRVGFNVEELQVITRREALVQSKKFCAGPLFVLNNMGRRRTRYLAYVDTSKRG